MEFIVALVVVAGLLYIAKKSFSKKEEVVATEAPYKVETPEAKVEAVNAQPIAEVKPAPAKKAPKAAPAKKPVAKKAPAKKAAPAKKPAKAKKPTSK